MARPKRNASQAGLDTAPAPPPVAKKGRRSNFRAVAETAATTRPRRSSAGNDDINAHVTPKKRGRPPKAASTSTAPAKAQKKAIPQNTSKEGNLANGSAPLAKATGALSAAQIAKGEHSKVGRKSKASKTGVKQPKEQEMATQERRGSDVSVEVPSRKVVQAPQEPDDEDEDEGGTSYWLMKAEPESRIEKGCDVRFSIDDLKNATEPEGWDGEFSIFEKAPWTCLTNS